MKAVLLFWHEALLHKRYLLRLKMFRVPRSNKYPEGVKYSYILFDSSTGQRVLMDNHHPKGPHFHLNDEEYDYKFKDGDMLLEDFARLTFEHLGLRI